MVSKISAGGRLRKNNQALSYLSFHRNAKLLQLSIVYEREDACLDLLLNCVSQAYYFLCEVLCIYNGCVGLSNKQN